MSIPNRRMPKAPNRRKDIHRDAGDHVSFPRVYVMKFVSIGLTAARLSQIALSAVTGVYAVCLTVAALSAFVGTKLQCSVVGFRPNARDLHRP